jgi:hypothetical protein
MKMNFKEGRKEYNHNIKWVFLMENEEIKNFFEDYVWDELENGIMHDLVKWTPMSKNGFENAIIKTGGSSGRSSDYANKNVLLYKDESVAPKINKSKFISYPKEASDFVDNTGNTRSEAPGSAGGDYTRQLLETGIFDDAIAQYEKKYTFSKTTDKTSSWKAAELKPGASRIEGKKYAGDFVNGKSIVYKMLNKIINMIGYPRMPGDKRELSLFGLDAANDSNEIPQEDEVQKAYDLLKNSGKYKVSKTRKVESYREIEKRKIQHAIRIIESAGLKLI